MSTAMSVLGYSVAKHLHVPRYNFCSTVCLRVVSNFSNGQHSCVLGLDKVTVLEYTAPANCFHHVQVTCPMISNYIVHDLMYKLLANLVVELV